MLHCWLQQNSSLYQKMKKKQSSSSTAAKMQAARSARKTREQLMQELNDDSLSQDSSSFPSRLHGYKLEKQEQKHQQSEQEDQDRSIDAIEERIKRLEMDLQVRISKQKDKPKVQVKKNKEKKVLKTPEVQSQSKKQGYGVKIDNPKREYLAAQKIQNQKQEKRKEKDKMPIKVVIEKERVESCRNLKKEPTIKQYSQQLAKARQQIQEQQITIEQLKAQNKRLKEELTHNRKGKSYEQALNGVEGEGKVKLAKQIQLLKIIEGLRAKLKKSIGRKLGSSKGALMQKGLPSGALG